MNEIRTLSELRSHSTEEDIKHIVTEYLMELIGRSEKLSEIETLVQAGKPISEIKEAL